MSKSNMPSCGRIKNKFEIRKNFEWTDKQKDVVATILDRRSKVVFIDAPAGVGKTHISVYCGLSMLSERKISQIIYTRTIAESSSKSIGSLPGESNDKFKPFMIPLLDKMNDMLSGADVQKLLFENHIKAIPVNFIRGSNFDNSYIIIEETQNFDIKELTTIMTRIGKHSKMVIIGDRRQSDINGKSGFYKMLNLFDDEEAMANGVYCFEFGIEDVMRSGICKFILERIETLSK